jgi:hypothetical protein
VCRYYSPHHDCRDFSRPAIHSCRRIWVANNQVSLHCWQYLIIVYIMVPPICMHILSSSKMKAEDDMSWFGGKTVVSCNQGNLVNGCLPMHTISNSVPKIKESQCTRARCTRVKCNVQVACIREWYLPITLLEASPTATLSINILTFIRISIGQFLHLLCKETG